MNERNVVVLDAPSNLGLRPPEDGVVPGCYKLPWALRDRGLLAAIQAEEGGHLVPPRYHAQWQPGDGDRNAEAIARYSIRLADRLQSVMAEHRSVLVLGGECSILLGNVLALKRRGRYGLVYLDAHSDFRHPDNAPAIGAAGGEALAIATGRGDARLVDLDGQGPYVHEEDVHLVGVRTDDDHLDELAATGIHVATSRDIAAADADRVVEDVLATVTRDTAGFWVHFDVDVVDAVEMPAVDCPEPDGPSFATVTQLLGRLLASPKCVGMEVTIYDPDRDPDGKCADRLVACLRQAYTVDDASLRRAC